MARTLLVVALALVACGRKTDQSRSPGAPPIDVAPARPPAIAATSRAAPTPNPSAAAVAFLQPLIALRITEDSDEFDSEGRWRAPSPVTPKADGYLDKILARRDSLGDEALAMLQGIYLGEDRGEIIDCETHNRGSRMLPWLARYRASNPRQWFPELPSKLVLDSTYFDRTIQDVQRGGRCEYGD